MILDNENKNLKVHEWIEQNTFQGNFDIVTGYFTIGALAYLSEKTNEKIEEYRFVIGDIVSTHDQKVKSIDLLNQNIDIETATSVANWARKAVDFLEQNKVICKTLEPNFCHAKLYLTKAQNNNPMQETYIMGSSNLTEAGVGLKRNRNIELNSAGTGTEDIYKQLKLWFENLWNSEKAHLKKTIKDEKGKEIKVDFKKYLIEEISKIFKSYLPIDIYQKVLFELFDTEEDAEFSREIGRLETSEIYKTLFNYQRLGAINLIKTLNKFDGALLADAVGLGKTWTTLAIVKYYRIKGRKSIILCPKKLQHNWEQYREGQNSIFESDDLNYQVYFHTDFTEDSVSKGKINFDFLNNEDPKLIIIDESHNLRNDKSIKYSVLMDEILKKSKGDIKILLLSATPINNNFKDVRNQFALLTKGDNGGFSDSLDIASLNSTFRSLQKDFKKWNTNPGKTLNSFYQEVKTNDFFKLSENLVVARTRKSIKLHFDQSIHFPKALIPDNIFETPMKIGDFDNLVDLMEKLKMNLSAYQPSQFTYSIEEINEKINAKKQKQEKDAVLKDEIQREYFLVKMMNILMLKRLESSWKAFQITIENIYIHHQNALNKIAEYEKSKKESLIAPLIIDPDDEDFESEIEKLTLGKKNPISIANIDKAGRLQDFKKAIIKDKENLTVIKNNLVDFQNEFEKKGKNDSKLNKLLEILKAKRLSDNPKVVIFSAYKDTADYLYTELKKRKFTSLGLVYGNVAISTVDENQMPIQKLLQHFAPYTKLYLEKRWANFSLIKNKENFENWKEWIKTNESNYFEVLENPIDILITTDVLSEGQNLQDADMVINYDIHWNPVRVIQRFGRIDRIGSPNDTIQCVNFWPAEGIEQYINLKSRVESRMAVMQLIGSEVVANFTEEFKEMAENPMEDRQNEALLNQMNDNLEDLDGEESIGFDDFSMDVYKQELSQILKDKRRDLLDLPNGIFSGIEIEGTDQKGMVALLGVLPKKENRYSDNQLVYLNEKGETISDNQRVVLEFLATHKDDTRNVPEGLDKGQIDIIEKYQQLLKNWLADQNGEENRAGKYQVDLINDLFQGKTEKLETIKEGTLAFTKKVDLITWLIVS